MEPQFFQRARDVLEYTRDPETSSSTLPIVKAPPGINDIPNGFSGKNFFLDLTPVSSPLSLEPQLDKRTAAINKKYTVNFLINKNLHSP